MTNDFYGFYKDENGYVVTKNGDDFLHTSTQISAADIVDRLMADNANNEEENNAHNGCDCRYRRRNKHETN